MNNKNQQQLLRDPDILPTKEVIKEALATVNDIYERFISELTNHNIDLEWRYYTDGKSWLGKGQHKWTGIRGGKKEVTVFWLSIWDGYFKVTIYIPEIKRADVLNLPLDDEIKKMISNSKQMGKLKFFPIIFDVDSDEQLEVIYTLIDYRRDIK